MRGKTEGNAGGFLVSKTASSLKRCLSLRCCRQGTLPPPGAYNKKIYYGISGWRRGGSGHVSVTAEGISAIPPAVHMATETQQAIEEQAIEEQARKSAAAKEFPRGGRRGPPATPAVKPECPVPRATRKQKRPAPRCDRKERRLSVSETVPFFSETLPFLAVLQAKEEIRTD